MAKYSEVIAGLQIALDVEGDRHHIDASHDIIYIGLEPSQISDEQKQILEDNGWHVSSESGTYARFT